MLLRESCEGDEEDASPVTWRMAETIHRRWSDVEELQKAAAQSHAQTTAVVAAAVVDAA